MEHLQAAQGRGTDNKILLSLSEDATLLTLCEACPSACGRAKHGGAAAADDDRLGMAEDRGAAGRHVSEAEHSACSQGRTGDAAVKRIDLHLEAPGALDVHEE